MIKRGEELEATMPLKEGKAIVSVFDVQRSSEIKNERTPEFFIGVFEAFLGICMRGYEHSPLRSQAFRLKETGDGFISTVGYPFLPSESRSLADSAVSTALSMFDVFNKEVEKFNYSRPIKAAIGLAYNSIQGTFQSGSIRSYDLFGDAIVQAAKYEELRKEVGLWAVFEDCARRQGFTDFHVLIIQEVVYNSLSPAYRDIFSEVDLVSMPLDELRVDPDARYVYFHVLE
jgi:class 3 adenylate cyclase